VKRARWVTLGLVLALGGAAGCGDAGEGSPDAQTADVAPDGPSAVDDGPVADAAVMEAGQDVPTPTDAGDDVGLPGMDASTDAGRDAGVDGGRDAGRDAMVDAGRDATVDGGRDADVDAGLPAFSGHTREFRGAWVATVFNIDWPSRTGLSAAAQRAEMDALLDAAAGAGLNAVMLQVRPEGDALYRSMLEPWSRVLGGRQGLDPGYDPLAYAIAEGHRRGIEVHAWINPFRARTSATGTSVAPHISITHPTACVAYDGGLWMNPAAPVVADRLAAVVEDILRRYEVDGIHFDDYFYPYPETGMAFPDSADYQRYRDGGGMLGLADWRRDNVNRVIERVGALVARVRPTARFGVSPFGIWRPGNPAGIVGLDAYNAIYCDAPRWMRMGWVDYLAPQLYWPSTQTAQAYGPLVRWWADSTADGRSVFGGNNLSRLGSSSAWTTDEMGTQLRLTRDNAARGARGNIYFTISQIRANRMGVAELLRRQYATPALPPPIATRRALTVAAPSVTRMGTTLTVTHPRAAQLRSWVVYRAEGAGWTVAQIVPAVRATVTVTAGRWAVTAADRDAVESPPVMVAVP
jgi:uncharacterized lipoprotein YddW (UPF0748 family)